MPMVDDQLFYIAADELLDLRKISAGDVVLKARKQLSQTFLCDGCFFFYMLNSKMTEPSMLVHIESVK
ncbi:hypothetical protein QD47_12515 [Paenibacillus terrae]|uniref:Uncharacterized protein n=1 Tax=Paenibacillus terrae TaxID=159743 RepID=A0A0D7X313_9BACL|nr:hypothetical protein QD47_12515 [Paenibacillus terrae]